MAALSIRTLLLTAATAAPMFLSIGIARAEGPPQAPAQQTLKSEIEGGNTREIKAPAGAAVPDVPTISFIESPTATCYQPDHTQDTCYINWYYLAVSADPNYMVSMQAEINVFGKVARYSGFFQTSMYVPFNMHDRGFKVACGGLGAGGDPEFGNAYAYTIRAKDSAALTSANYGTVFCPAYTP
ncbi:hypothetical protein [Dokdonella immobilis]|uniref:Uncharacterized protein n=1 Tax=Dokdonella immobilis TaxID=578942 RepID=A0A1I5A9U5_9GAMM|nr:hypothetical protein [Dokdonella immobilis]SFN59108.1 hypothetical protein SAMN05216289_1348 [Dokdonella immobilis]